MTQIERGIVIMADSEQRKDEKQEAETPYAVIAQCSNEMLIKVLEAEPPHTAALIIGRLPVEKEAAVLKQLLPRLSDDRKKIIVMELAFGISELAESIQRIETNIAEKITWLTEKRYTQIGGNDFVSKMMSLMDSASRNEVFALLNNANTALYEKVTADMFRFEDIVRLSNHAIQKIMSEIDTIIETCDTETLCTVLQQEEPFIISLLLGSLPVHKAAALLQALPDRIRLPVIEYLAWGDWESADVLALIAADIQKKIERHAAVPSIELGGTRLPVIEERAGGDGESANVLALIAADIQKKIEQHTAVPSIELGGTAFLRKIIDNADSVFTEDMLTFLEESKHPAYAALRKHVFLFEDITQVDDYSIQKILREIPTTDLALALQVPSPAVQEKIERNISPRVVTMLREEIDYMGPTTIRQVRDARRKILNVVCQMEANGDIVLPFHDIELLKMRLDF